MTTCSCGGPGGVYGDPDASGIHRSFVVHADAQDTKRWDGSCPAMGIVNVGRTSHGYARDDVYTRELDTASVAATLGVAVKYREDAARVRASLDRLMAR